jgi:hypothetical protein
MINFRALSPIDLQNFVRTAAQMGIPPQQALFGLMALEMYQDAMLRGFGQGSGFNPQMMQNWNWNAGAMPRTPAADPNLMAELTANRVAAGSGRGATCYAPRQTAQARVPNEAPSVDATAAPRISLPTNGPADARLASLQDATVASAQRELDRHVSVGSTPDRVQQYAKDGGMDGGAWCGYFAGFNYDEAAKQAGGRFGTDARFKFHSMQKARAYFEYSNYTTDKNDDALRDKQAGEGSTRRWMTLEGSHGQQHAVENHRPVEVYKNPSELPIRKGDTVLYSFGHVGLVKDYDPKTGVLTTIEGNAGGGKVREFKHDLNDPKVRATIEGFGRPALGDFQLPADGANKAPNA